MKHRNLITLLLVAVLLVGGAILSDRRNKSEAPSMGGRLVLPELAVNSVRKIVLTDGERTATVHRPGEVWVSADLFEHPADFPKIRGLLIKLAELKVGQTTRLNDAQKNKLKLVMPAAAAAGATSAVGAASGTRLTLLDGQGQTLATLLVGAEYMRQPPPGAEGGFGGYPDGRYVSTDEGKSAFIVADALGEVATDPLSWVDTAILSVPSSDVETVTIRSVGAEPLVLEQDASALVVRGLAADEETDSSKAQSIRSALSWLRFTRIAEPALTDAQTGMTNAVLFEAVTSKGQIYRATVGGTVEGGDDRYARFGVSLKPEEPEPAVEGEEDEAAAAQRQEAAEQRRKARAELEEETAKLNRRLEGWTYTIATHSADAMRVERGAVAKKKTAEESTTTGESDPDAAAPTPAPTTEEG